MYNLYLCWCTKTYTKTDASHCRCLRTTVLKVRLTRGSEMPFRFGMACCQ